MWRSTKSNTQAIPAWLRSRHVMSRKQLSRRVEIRAADLGIPGMVEVGRYRYTEAYEGLRPRAHPGDLEICFLARGHQTYRVNGEVYRLRGGDQYLVFPGEPHDSAGMPEEKGILYWVCVRLLPARAGLLFLEGRAAARLRRALARLPSRHFAAGPGTQELLERMLAAFSAKPLDELRRLEAASMILRYLFATIEASRRNQRAEPSARIRRAIEAVARCSDEIPRVPQLAREVGLSTSRFKARFRAEAGMPPREFVLRHKVTLARSRLAEPGATVTGVAHQLGFSSSQYFATVFRRFSGASPSTFLTPQRASSFATRASSRGSSE
jgi:AraC-like DNA-binding protein